MGRARGVRMSAVTEVGASKLWGAVPVASSAVILAAACVEVPPADPVTRVDSAGVEIVHSREPAWGPGEAWTVGEVSLGLGSEDDPFFDVVGALRRPGGGVAVALGSSGEIRFYGPEGTLEASHGGSGDGPGEFRILQKMGQLVGDTVWAYDFSLTRMTLLHPVDGVVGVVSLRPPPQRGLAVGVIAGGGWLLREAWGESQGRLEPGLRRDAVRIFRADAGGTLLDTLASVPGREVLLTDEGGRAVMGTAPFARNATVAATGREVVVGDQAGYELRFLDLTGRLVQTVRWEGPSRTLTDDEVAEWKEAQVTAADPRDQAGVRAYLQTVPVPDSRPSYGAILPDEEGQWWVSSYAHPGRAPDFWDVFDQDGRWLGPVPMPPRFRPLQIGPEWILGHEVDELGVERVVLRELSRPR